MGPHNIWTEIKASCGLIVLAFVITPQSQSHDKKKLVNESWTLCGSPSSLFLILATQGLPLPPPPAASLCPALM